MIYRETLRQLTEGEGHVRRGRGTSHLLLHWPNILRIQMGVRVEEGPPRSVAFQGYDRSIGNICSR